jgi:hypothetical protein
VPASWQCDVGQDLGLSATGLLWESMLGIMEEGAAKMKLKERAYRYGGVVAVECGKKFGAGRWPAARSTNGVVA